MFGIGRYNSITDQIYMGTLKNNPLNKIQSNHIVHNKIKNKFLKKIRKIYRILRFALNELKICSLEQFEILFMKECDIKKAVEKWEKILKINIEYINFLNGGWFSFWTEATVIILTLMCENNYKFSRKDKKDDIIKEIIEIYEKIK